ncbi:hypothetical protein NPIL_587631 [Nephila pilipes]|uniref:Uncharacterized protein n=1 Tax=Nephila pilipes TaxID=299642 RepID=A0A8X6TWC4_NEPPI|nr:hypothetical protein NPIL_587631 [Nephila pilipes]
MFKFHRNSKRRLLSEYALGNNAVYFPFFFFFNKRKRRYFEILPSDPNLQGPDGFVWTPSLSPQTFRSGFKAIPYRVGTRLQEIAAYASHFRFESGKIAESTFWNMSGSGRTRPAKRTQTRPWSGAGLRRSPSKHDTWQSVLVLSAGILQSPEFRIVPSRILLTFYSIKGHY